MARVAVAALVVSAAAVGVALAQPDGPDGPAAVTAAASAAAKAKAADNAAAAERSAKHADASKAAKASSKRDRSGKRAGSKRSKAKALARQLELQQRLAQKPDVLTADGRIVSLTHQAKVRPTRPIAVAGTRRHVEPKSTRSTVKQRSTPPKSVRKSAAYRLSRQASTDPAPTSGGVMQMFTAATTGTGSISGTLSDAVTGLPVAGACVESYLSGGDQAGPVACSDASGLYQLTNLDPGSYYLHVTDHVSGHLSTWTQNNVQVQADQAVTDVNFSLGQGGMIAGTVTDEHGNPLEGVCAEVDSLDYNDSYDGGCSDANGHYQSAGIPAGTWKVSFDDHQGQHLSQWFNGVSSFSDASEVVVAVGQVTANIDAAMVLGGSISGTVTGSGGTPLQDICVAISSVDLGVDEQACTDATGAYRSPGLPTGSYVVHFEDYSGEYRDEYYDNVTVDTAATPVDVTLGNETPHIDATLTRKGVIQGTVTAAATGVPLSGVCVEAVDSNGGWAVDAETALDGTYTLTGLDDGSYKVMFGCDYGAWIAQWYDGAATAADATPVSAASETVTSNIDAALDRYGSISGTVTAPATVGGPAAGICVDATSTTNPDGPHGTGDGYTDADGHYTVPGLVSDTYTVRFTDCADNPTYVTRYYGNTVDAASSTTVDVTLHQDTPGIDNEMVVGGSIRGTVTAADTGAPLSACVSVYPVGSTDNVGWADAAADGTYTLGGLESGSYDVYFEDCQDGAHLPVWNGGSRTRAGATSVSVVLGDQVAGVDAALPLGGSISGTVTDAASGGAPVGDVCVSVYDATNLDYPVTGFGLYDGATTYTVRGLGTGNYLVRFDSCWGGQYQTQWYDHATDSTTATPVSVTEGTDHPNVDAAMVKLGQISGTVTAADTGDPLSGVCVSVYNASNLDNPVNNDYGTCTDDQGHYTVTGLPTGQLVVRFAPKGKYVGEWFNDKTDGYDADLIRVQAGDDIKNIDAALTLGGTISGTITSGGSPSSGCVQVYDVITGQYVGLSACSDGTTGQYTLQGIPAGTYKVSIYRYTGQFQELWWDNQQDFASATPVVVNAGDAIDHIDADFPDTAGPSVSGTVTLAKTGGPAPNFCVYLVATASLNTAGYSCQYSSTDGQYSVGNVQPGTYYVQFSPLSGTAGIGEFYSGADSYASAQVVTVADTAVTGIDASLREGGHISGTVTDATTGDPLPNICGYVQQNTSAQQYFYYGQTCTDAQGHYTTPDLAAGSYSLTLRDDYGPYLDQTYPNPIDVTLANTTSGVDFAMVKGGTFSGTVTDVTTGTPLSDICVNAYSTDSQTEVLGRCSHNGTYTTPGLPAGNYKLEFTNPSGRYITEWYDDVATQADATALPVVLGQDTANIDASLQLGGVVAGTVTSKSTGEPLSGVCVTLYHLDGSFGGLGNCTGADGKYESAAVPAGQYKVGFSDNSGTYAPQYYNGKKTLADADAVTVTAGGRTSGINAALNSSTVRGTVTDAATGKPLPGVCVYLYTSGGDYSGLGTCTLADGTYVLDGIPAGDYQAAFFDPAGTHVTEWYDGASQQSGATVLTAPGDLSGVDAAMTPITTVTGTVTDSLTGQPLAGVCAYLYLVGSDGSSAASCTGEDGRVVFQDVAAGDYQLAFADTAGVHETQWYSGAGDRGGSTVIHLTDGAIVSDADAAMVPITTVAGKVTDAVTGDPVSGVCAYLYPVGSDNSAAASCTSADGRVVFQGMEPGDYQLAYADTAGALATEWYGGSHLRSGAEVITLAQGQAKLDADVALDKTGAISGTVTSAGSTAPAPGVCVYADDINGNYTGVGACTDANGQYTLPDLSPGKYTLGFYPPGMPSPTNIWYSGASSEADATKVTVTAGQTTTGIDQTVP